MIKDEKNDFAAHMAKVDWENSCMKEPLHVILPADPGTFTLWTDWPNVPHRERVIAWDINTSPAGWRWPITLSAVECETGRPVLYPDGTINETGFDGASWANMEEFICAEMKCWAEKCGTKVKT